MKDIQQKLLDMGYKYSTARMYDVLKCTEHLYQKRVVDDVGTRYFVNVWYYPETTINGTTLQEGCQMEVDLYNREGDVMMEVTPSVGKGDFEEAEQLVEKVWELLEGGYYDGIVKDGEK